MIKFKRTYEISITLMGMIYLSSCGLIYHTQNVEEHIEDNYFVNKKTQIKKRGLATCFTKEVITKVDTLTNELIFKEELTRDCKGAYSYVTKRKKWEMENGQLVQSITRK